MELFQLRYFEAVARLGSMTAAAARCHVSQPSLSAQVRALEEELGVRLFERRARGVVATAAGRRALLTARRMLAEAEELRRDIRRRSFRGPPPLRLGVQPFLAAEAIAEPLARCAGSGEAARVVVRELPQSRLHEAVQSGEVDVALLVSGGAVPPGVEVRELFAMGYIACTLAGGGAKLPARVRLGSLLRRPLVLFSDTLGLPERVAAAAEDAGCAPHVACTSDHAHTVLELASAGLGVGILPALLRERALRRRLQVARLAEPWARVRIVALWRRTHGLAPSAELLLDSVSRHNKPRVVR